MSPSVEWIEFVQQRCWDLHNATFNPDVEARIGATEAKRARCTYAAYSKELNRLGFGTDYSAIPQLQYPYEWKS